MPYRKPSPNALPHHVAESGNSFIVRIERDEVIYHESFAHGQYGTRRKALKAAVQWRDEVLSILPEIFYPGGFLRKAAAPTKCSDLPAGISRYWSTRRKPTHSCYLIYAVNYVHEGKASILRFYAGSEVTLTPEMEMRAEKAARACRADYVHCMLNGLRFDPRKYADWKNDQLGDDASAQRESTRVRSSAFKKKAT